MAKDTKRGFAGMSAEKRRLIASMGGKALHKLGKAHEWTAGPGGTAAKAGRKGGLKGGHRKRTAKATALASDVTQPQPSPLASVTDDDAVATHLADVLAATPDSLGGPDDDDDADDEGSDEFFGE